MAQTNILTQTEISLKLKYSENTVNMRLPIAAERDHYR